VARGSIALNLERVKVAHWDRHLPAGVARSEVDLLAGGSLSARIVGHWRAQPSRGVLADLDGRWLTGGELDERSAALALALRAGGLGPGDRFALCAGSSAAWVIAYLAALRAGLVAVPINPDYTRVEVRRIAGDAAPRAAFVDDDARARWLREACPDGVVVLGPGLEAPAAGAAGPERPAAAGVGVLS